MYLVWEEQSCAIMCPSSKLILIVVDMWMIKKSKSDDALHCEGDCQS